MNERLKKQMEFILEIDKLKNITRQTYISDCSRRENDTEHSWHLAMMCMLLSEYSNEKIDVLRTMSMVLIHDIIEIDAGDTYAYDDAGNATKRDREVAAADRLFNILPSDQAEYVRGLWDEFEEGVTPEARFANAVDRIQPTMLNDASEGMAWDEHGIDLSRIIHRNSNTKYGSDILWDYALNRNIIPNVKKGKIKGDTENIDYERFELVFERIQSLKDDEADIPDRYKAYINAMSEALSEYYKCLKWVSDMNYVNVSSIYFWYKDIDEEKWKTLNNSVNRFRYDTEYYKTSYANPTVSVGIFGKDIGHMLSYVAAQICSLGALCFEGRYFELTIIAELFMEIYDILRNNNEDEYSGAIKSAIYYFIYDYMDDYCEFKVRDSLGCGNDHMLEILKHMDVYDTRSLYLYGENIGNNEIGTFKYLAGLDEDKIRLIATTYVEGYIESFRLAGIDLSDKKTVQIRYPIGFERIVKEAVHLFEEKGLKSVIVRSGGGRLGNNMNSTGSIDPNRQFAYDHRYDSAIYYNKAIKERTLCSMKQAYEKYKEEAAGYAGPAVIECFGELDFKPAVCEEACKLDDKQQELTVQAGIELSNLVNEYIPRDKFSFTIIAFPLPDIGEDYEKIFEETIKINTLDQTVYEMIQQKIIDVLDECDHVLITGKDGNKTHLVIRLADITDEKKETRFHNCLADCNIPLGEVYTSPKLTGTNGLLNVKQVYINGLQYNDLKINIENGRVKDYTCGNYDNEKDNIDYVNDNLMKHRQNLPLGEFAIGTNTTAYAMGRRYNIADKLPILIAEKTGPHIAIGDTCFSMAEDLPIYNPDGKEVIARDNEITSANRKSAPDKAYFGCHTDITIPYNELGKIAAVDSTGLEKIIISDGRFVLPGTELLNEVL